MAVVAEEDRGAFCMQLQAIEFMAEQDQMGVRNYDQR